MTDGGDWWSHPSGGDPERGPWWTPQPASTGGWQPEAGRSKPSWRSNPPSWTVLALVSALTAVLGGTIGGVIAHQSSDGSSTADSSPTTVSIGSTSVPATAQRRATG